MDVHDQNLGLYIVDIDHFEHKQLHHILLVVVPIDLVDLVDPIVLVDLVDPIDLVDLVDPTVLVDLVDLVVPIDLVVVPIDLVDLPIDLVVHVLHVVHVHVHVRDVLLVPIVLVDLVVPIDLVDLVDPIVLDLVVLVVPTVLDLVVLVDPIGLVVLVELFKGQDALLHVSKISHERVNKPEDVLKIGDVIKVKVMEIDEKGRINDSGTEEWLEQSNNKLGENTIKVAEELGIGTQDYNLIDVDEGKEESSYLWLYITLGIVGLIIAGVVGYLIFSKVRKEKDDELVDKITDE